MHIDTHYKTGQQIVMITLLTPAARELTDDLLARIGCNQHRLEWINGDSGDVSLGEDDPATFRIPPAHRVYTVRRVALADHLGGAEFAEITYNIGESE